MFVVTALTTTRFTSLMEQGYGYVKGRSLHSDVYVYQIFRVVRCSIFLVAPAATTPRVLREPEGFI